MYKSIFASLVHLSERTIERMIKRGELPLLPSGDIDYFEFAPEGLRYTDFLKGRFYSRETARRGSKLSKYDFNKYWRAKISRKEISFYIGDTDFYYFEHEKSIYSDFLEKIEKSEDRLLTALIENLIHNYKFSYEELKIIVEEL